MADALLAMPVSSLARSGAIDWKSRPNPFSLALQGPALYDFRWSWPWKDGCLISKSASRGFSWNTAGLYQRICTGGYKGKPSWRLGLLVLAASGWKSISSAGLKTAFLVLTM